MAARSITVQNHTGTKLPEYNTKIVIVKIQVGQGAAPSYGVTATGDMFRSKNRLAVLARFGLVQGPDDIARPA